MLDFRYDTFLDLCETLNYSRTAENLHLSQPTVTQHIQHLERHYGTSLFLYRSKRLQLTEKGEELYRQVRRIRGMIRQAERQMAAPTGPRTLRIGATKTIGAYVLPPAVESYLRENPDTDIDLYVDNTRALLGRLNAGLLDFAYLEGFFNKSTYAHRLLRREQFLGVCAPDSPPCGAAPGARGPAGGAAHYPGAGLRYPGDPGEDAPAVLLRGQQLPPCQPDQQL